MSPRRYQMQARFQAMAETRARIVRAATELHTERGILATSWEEIAERAGVAPATVYRHFPSLVELIPACARSVFDVVAQPTLEEAGAKFEHLSGPAERLEFFIRESCVCYAAGEGWLHAARREIKGFTKLHPGFPRSARRSHTRSGSSWATPAT